MKLELTEEQKKLYNNQLREIDFWNKISGAQGWKYMAAKVFWIIFMVFILLWLSDFFIAIFKGSCKDGCNDFFPYLFNAFKITYPPTSSPWYHVVFYLIMGVFALCLTPVLTTCIMRAIDSRTDAIRKGRKVYKNLYGHFVLIGYNRFAVQIIRDIFKNNDAYAIVLTTQDPVKLRETLENELEKELSKRVIFYAGDAIVPENVSKLNLSYAQKAYLLDESEPHASQYARNLSVLKNIVNEVSNMENEPLEVYMQVNNSKSYNLLQSVDVPIEFFQNKNGKVVVDFRPFNFYENWARLLWSYYKLPQYDTLDFEPLDLPENINKYVHLVVSNFNSMGRALLLEAIRLCHYPNYDEKTSINKTVISVFDAKWEEEKVSFYAQYPYLEQITDIEVEFYPYNIDHPDARHSLNQWAKDNNQLLTIAICDKEPDIAMTKAVNLPEAVYYQKDKFSITADKKENRNTVRVLIRQELETTSEEIFTHQNSIAYPHVKFFGMLQNGVDMKQIDDRIAMCINGIYNDESVKGNYYTVFHMSESKCQESIKKIFSIEHDNIKQDKHEWHNLWLSLPENMKWSNRFQTDIYGTYIQILSRIQQLPPNEYETIKKVLPEIEHRRWCAERTLAGWRQKDKDEIRVDERRIHKSIIPHKELSDSEKVKDYNVIATAKLIIDEANNLYGVNNGNINL